METQRAAKECIQLNVFKEYNAMKDRQRNDYDEARFLILRGTVKMVTFDPENGDMKEKISDSSQEKIGESCKRPNHDGCDGRIRW